MLFTFCLKFEDLTTVFNTANNVLSANKYKLYKLYNFKFL